MEYNKPNCPYCDSEFGQTSEFMMGCTDEECPERPQFHDPIGRSDCVDEFWEQVIYMAPQFKKMKKIEWQMEKILMEIQIEKYYK